VDNSQSRDKRAYNEYLNTSFLEDMKKLK